MIPPDVVSLLRTNLPDIQSQARREPEVLSTAAAQRLPDVLSDQTPGQRILAEIQALLPNGSYRAMIAQREITLALPFSAKPGDTLELEVRESEGKTVLAFIGKHENTPAEQQNLDPSVRASLSPTGKLIGNLLSPSVDEQGAKRNTPVALNNQQPLLADPESPTSALAQKLQSALAESGVFYEAHQARWVRGEIPVASLLREPQGQLSPRLVTPDSFIPQAANPIVQPQTVSEHPHPISSHVALTGLKPSLEATESESHNRQTPLFPPLGHSQKDDESGKGLIMRDIGSTPSNAGAATATSSAITTLPSEVIHVVRNQLDALASQQYVWQGMAWQDQPVRWEISEFVDERNPLSGETPEQSWQTRLTLELPRLGGVEATLRLFGNNQLFLDIKSTTQSGETGLRAGQGDLDQQLSTAGFTLRNMSIQHVDRKEQPAT